MATTHGSCIVIWNYRTQQRLRTARLPQLPDDSAMYLESPALQTDLMSQSSTAAIVGDDLSFTEPFTSLMTDVSTDLSSGVKQWSSLVKVAGSASCFTAVAFTIDDELILAGCSNGSLYMFDAKSAVFLRRIDEGAVGHFEAIRCIRFSSDGRMMCTSDSSGRLLVWETQFYNVLNMTELVPIPQPSLRFQSVPMPVQPAPPPVPFAGLFAAAAPPKPQATVTVIRRRSYESESDSSSDSSDEVDPSAALVRVAEAPKSGGSAAAVLGGTEERTEKKRELFVSPKFAFSPMGSLLALPNKNRINLISPETGGVIIPFGESHSAPVTYVSFSSNGKMLASASMDSTTFVWDVENAAKVVALKSVPKSAVLSVEFLNSDQWVITAAMNMTATVWSALGGEQLCVYNDFSPGLLTPQPIADLAVVKWSSNRDILFMMAVDSAVHIFGLPGRWPESPVKGADGLIESEVAAIAEAALAAEEVSRLAQEFNENWIRVPSVQSCSLMAVTKDAGALESFADTAREKVSGFEPMKKICDAIESGKRRVICKSLFELFALDITLDLDLFTMVLYASSMEKCDQLTVRLLVRFLRQRCMKELIIKSDSELLGGCLEVLSGFISSLVGESDLWQCVSQLLLILQSIEIVTGSDSEKEKKSSVFDLFTRKVFFDDLIQTLTKNQLKLTDTECLIIGDFLCDEMTGVIPKCVASSSITPVSLSSEFQTVFSALECIRNLESVCRDEKLTLPVQFALIEISTLMVLGLSSKEDLAKQIIGRDTDGITGFSLMSAQKNWVSWECRSLIFDVLAFLIGVGSDITGTTLGLIGTARSLFIASASLLWDDRLILRLKSCIEGWSMEFLVDSEDVCLDADTLEIVAKLNELFVDGSTAADDEFGVRCVDHIQSLGASLKSVINPFVILSMLFRLAIQCEYLKTKDEITQQIIFHAMVFGLTVKQTGRDENPLVVPDEMIEYWKNVISQSDRKLPAFEMVYSLLSNLRKDESVKSNLGWLTDPLECSSFPNAFSESVSVCHAEFVSFLSQYPPNPAIVALNKLLYDFVTESLIRRMWNDQIIVALSPVIAAEFPHQSKVMQICRDLRTLDVGQLSEAVSVVEKMDAKTSIVNSFVIFSALVRAILDLILAEGFSSDKRLFKTCIVRLRVCLLELREIVKFQKREHCLPMIDHWRRECSTVLAMDGSLKKDYSAKDESADEKKAEEPITEEKKEEMDEDSDEEKKYSDDSDDEEKKEDSLVIPDSTPKSGDVLILDKVYQKEVRILHGILDRLDVAMQPTNAAEKLKEMGSLTSLVGSIGQVSAVAFSQDGTYIAAGGDENTVLVWNAQSFETVQILIGHSAKVTCVAFHPRNRTLASSSLDQTIRLWNPSDGTGLKTLTAHKSPVMSLAYTFNSGNLLISSAGDSKLVVYSVDSDYTVIRDMATESPICESVAFSPNGFSVAFTAGPMIMIKDAITGTDQLFFFGHAEDVTCVRFSKAGFNLVSGSRDCVVKVWTVATADCQSNLVGHEAPVNDVWFVRDDSWVVSCSDDMSVRIWQTWSGVCYRKIMEHSSPVTCLAYNESLKLFASGSADRKCLVFQVPTKSLDWERIPDDRTVAEELSETCVPFRANPEAVADINVAIAAKNRGDLLKRMRVLVLESDVKMRCANLVACLTNPDCDAWTERILGRMLRSIAVSAFDDPSLARSIVATILNARRSSVILDTALLVAYSATIQSMSAKKSMIGLFKDVVTWEETTELINSGQINFVEFALLCDYVLQHKEKQHERLSQLIRVGSESSDSRIVCSCVSALTIFAKSAGSSAVQSLAISEAGDQSRDLLYFLTQGSHSEARCLTVDALLYLQHGCRIATQSILNARFLVEWDHRVSLRLFAGMREWNATNAEFLNDAQILDEVSQLSSYIHARNMDGCHSLLQKMQRTLRFMNNHLPLVSFLLALTLNTDDFRIRQLLMDYSLLMSLTLQSKPGSVIIVQSDRRLSLDNFTQHWRDEIDQAKVKSDSEEDGTIPSLVILKSLLSRIDKPAPCLDILEDTTPTDPGLAFYIDAKETTAVTQPIQRRAIEMGTFLISNGPASIGQCVEKILQRRFCGYWQSQSARAFLDVIASRDDRLFMDDRDALSISRKLTSALKSGDSGLSLKQFGLLRGTKLEKIANPVALMSAVTQARLAATEACCNACLSVGSSALATYEPLLVPLRLFLFKITRLCTSLNIGVPEKFKTYWAFEIGAAKSRLLSLTDQSDQQAEEKAGDTSMKEPMKTPASLAQLIDQETKEQAILAGMIERLTTANDLSVDSPSEDSSAERAAIKQIAFFEGSSVSPITSVAWSIDGMLVASADSSFNIVLWESTFHSLIFSFASSLHTDTINDILFAPSGEYLVTASNDASIKVWDMSTVQCQNTLSQHGGHVTSLSISSDGSLLASCSKDGSTIVWSVVHGFEVKCVFTSSDVTTSRRLCFRPGIGVENILAVPSGTQVDMYSADSGKTLQTIRGFGDAVTCVSFSTDGKMLVSGSRDGSVSVWRWERAEKIGSYLGKNPAPISRVYFCLNNSCFLAVSQGMESDSNINLWQLSNTVGKVASLDHSGGGSRIGLNVIDERFILGNSKGITTWRLPNKLSTKWPRLVTDLDITHEFLGMASAFEPVSHSDGSPFAMLMNALDTRNRVEFARTLAELDTRSIGTANLFSSLLGCLCHPKCDFWQSRLIARHLRSIARSCLHSGLDLCAGIIQTIMDLMDSQIKPDDSLIWDTLCTIALISYNAVNTYRKRSMFHLFEGYVSFEAIEKLVKSTDDIDFISITLLCDWVIICDDASLPKVSNILEVIDQCGCFLDFRKDCMFIETIVSLIQRPFTRERDKIKLLNKLAGFGTDSFWHCQTLTYQAQCYLLMAPQSESLGWLQSSAESKVQLKELAMGSVRTALETNWDSQVIPLIYNCMDEWEMKMDEFSDFETMKTAQSMIDNVKRLSSADDMKSDESVIVTEIEDLKSGFLATNNKNALLSFLLNGAFSSPSESTLQLKLAQQCVELLLCSNVINESVKPMREYWTKRCSAFSEGGASALRILSAVVLNILNEDSAQRSAKKAVSNTTPKLPGIARFLESDDWTVACSAGAMIMHIIEHGWNEEIKIAARVSAQSRFTFEWQSEPAYRVSGLFDELFSDDRRVLETCQSLQKSVGERSEELYSQTLATLKSFDWKEICNPSAVLCALINICKQAVLETGLSVVISKIRLLIIDIRRVCVNQRQMEVKRSLFEVQMGELEDILSSLKSRDDSKGEAGVLDQKEFEILFGVLRRMSTAGMMNHSVKHPDEVSELPKIKHEMVGLTGTATGKQVFAMAFDPLSGNDLAIGYSTGYVALMDLRNMELKSKYEAKPKMRIYGLTFHPHQPLLAFSKRDTKIYVCETKKMDIVQTLAKHSGLVWSVSFSPDGSVLVSDSYDMQIHIWDTKTWKLSRVILTDSQVFRPLRFCPNSSRFAIGVGTKINVYDYQTYKVVVSMDGHEQNVFNCRFNEGGTLLASSVYNDGEIKLWDAQNGGCMGVFGEKHSTNKHLRMVTDMLFCNSDQWLVSCSEDKSLQIWNVDDFSMLRSVMKCSQKFRCLALSPLKDTFVAGAEDGVVYQFEIPVNYAEWHAIPKDRTIAYEVAGARPPLEDTGFADELIQAREPCKRREIARVVSEFGELEEASDVFYAIIKALGSTSYIDKWSVCLIMRAARRFSLEIYPDKTDLAAEIIASILQCEIKDTEHLDEIALLVHSAANGHENSIFGVFDGKLLWEDAFAYAERHSKHGNVTEYCMFGDWLVQNNKPLDDIMRFVKRCVAHRSSKFNRCAIETLVYFVEECKDSTETTEALNSGDPERPGLMYFLEKGEWEERALTADALAYLAECGRDSVSMTSVGLLIPVMHQEFDEQVSYRLHRSMEDWKLEVESFAADFAALRKTHALLRAVVNGKEKEAVEQLSNIDGSVGKLRNPKPVASCLLRACMFADRVRNIQMLLFHETIRIALSTSNSSGQPMVLHSKMAHYWEHDLEGLVKSNRGNWTARILKEVMSRISTDDPDSANHCWVSAFYSRHRSNPGIACYLWASESDYDKRIAATKLLVHLAQRGSEKCQNISLQMLRDRLRSEERPMKAVEFATDCGDIFTEDGKALTLANDLSDWLKAYNYEMARKNLSNIDGINVRKLWHPCLLLDVVLKLRFDVNVCRKSDIELSLIVRKFAINVRRHCLNKDIPVPSTMMQSWLHSFTQISQNPFYDDSRNEMTILQSVIARMRGNVRSSDQIREGKVSSAGMASGPADLTTSDESGVLLDATGHEMKFVLLGHLRPKRSADQIESLAMAHTCPWLAAGDTRGNIRIWDLGSMSQRTILTNHVESVTAVAFSPDDSLLVSASKNDAVIFHQMSDPQGKYELRSIKSSNSTGNVRSIAFSADGSRIAIVASDQCTITVFDTDTLTETDTFRADGYAKIASVDFHPNVEEQPALLAYPNTNRVQLSDVMAKEKKVSQVKDSSILYSVITRVCFSLEGQMVAALNQENHVYVYSVSDSKLLKTLKPIGGDVTGMHFVNNDEWVAVTLSSGRLLFFSIDSGKSIQQLSSNDHSYAAGASTSSFGATAFFGGSSSKRKKGGVSIRTAPIPAHRMTDLAVYHRLGLVAVACSDKNIRVWKIPQSSSGWQRIMNDFTATEEVFGLYEPFVISEDCLSHSVLSILGAKEMGKEEHYRALLKQIDQVSEHVQSDVSMMEVDQRGSLFAGLCKCYVTEGCPMWASLMICQLLRKVSLSFFPELTEHSSRLVATILEYIRSAKETLGKKDDSTLGLRSLAIMTYSLEDAESKSIFGLFNGDVTLEESLDIMRQLDLNHVECSLLSDYILHPNGHGSWMWLSQLTSKCIQINRWKVDFACIDALTQFICQSAAAAEEKAEDPDSERMQALIEESASKPGLLYFVVHRSWSIRRFALLNIVFIAANARSNLAKKALDVCHRHLSVECDQLVFQSVFKAMEDWGVDRDDELTEGFSMLLNIERLIPLLTTADNAAALDSSEILKEMRQLKQIQNPVPLISKLIKICGGTAMVSEVRSQMVSDVIRMILCVGRSDGSKIQYTPEICLRWKKAILRSKATDTLELRSLLSVIDQLSV